MAKSPKRSTNDVAGLLTDLLITQLAAAGVQQQTIRGIVGCKASRVSRITQHIKAARKTAAEQDRD